MINNFLAFLQLFLSSIFPSWIRIHSPASKDTDNSDDDVVVVTYLHTVVLPEAVPPATPIMKGVLG